MSNGTQESDALLPQYSSDSTDAEQESPISHQNYGGYDDTDTTHQAEDDEGEDTVMFSSLKAFHPDAPPLVSNSIQGSTQSIVAEVKAALQDHLEDALDGADDYFLTMGLTKNLSLLPSKAEVTQTVEEVQEEFDALKKTLSFGPRKNQAQQQQQAVTRQDDNDDDDTDESSSPPLKAYLILGLAVCALSSIGPCLAKQVDCDPVMKIVWRFQGTVVMLSPFAIHSIIADGIPKLSWAQWGTFLLSAASYAVLCAAFAMSINYTTVANATILTNSQSVLLVVAKLLFGQQVIFLEGLGVFVAFFGGILAAREAAGDEAAPAQGWWSVWGDALGIISSIGGMGYIVLGKSLRAHFPVLLFMVMNMFTASFICLLWMYALGKEVSWDMHYNHGVFGWMRLEFQRLTMEVITVMVCNVLGTLGYVRAFKYFSSVIIAVAALLEPVVAAFTATAIGVGVLPGFEGWVGNILVIVGTLAVLYPTTPQYQAEQKRKERIAQKKAETPRTHFPRLRTPRLQASPRRRRLGEEYRNNAADHSHEEDDGKAKIKLGKQHSLV